MALELDVLPASVPAPEREAYELGQSRGYDHANYALNYGEPINPWPAVPQRFVDAGGVVHESYRDGFGTGVGQAERDHNALG